MSAKDRRRALYEKINQARQSDPEVFQRLAVAPDAVARQAYHSSRIEGCQIELETLRELATSLAENHR